MISVIVPAHNEARQLQKNLPVLIEFLDGFGTDYELIIAEDGSSDETLEVAESFRSDKVIIYNSKKRLGRGLAVSKAIKNSHGDIAVYMDADLATGPNHLKQLIGEINNGADVSTGSRLLSGSRVIGRNPFREFFSRGYNIMLRLLFRTVVRDHQCGFKAFKKASVLPILDEIRNTHWFWDSELLIRAQLKGLKVTEIPVEWTDSKESTINLFHDIPDMLIAAIRLRFELW